MNRRQFINYSLGGLALSSLSGTTFFYKSTQTIAAEVIMNKLDFLTLDKKGVHAFVADYMQNIDYLLQTKIRTAYFLNLPGEQFRYWDELIDAYLLSTDFFRNKMDENKVVMYTGSVYNPYKMPCANPFSNLYYPDTEVAMME